MMAVIIPYGETWLHLRTARRNPDMDDLCFGRAGEFSPYSDIAFEKHITRLDKICNFFANENGERIKKIKSAEKLWY